MVSVMIRVSPTSSAAITHTSCLFSLRPVDAKNRSMDSLDVSNFNFVDVGVRRLFFPGLT